MNISELIYIYNRRKELRTVKYNTLSDLSESCIPSYCHSNLLASIVAWSRLFYAKSLYHKYSSGNIVLDFGAGSGELGRLLDSCSEYTFIENTDELANLIKVSLPLANRSYLNQIGVEKYDAIFCLDSLEHNLNYMNLIDQVLISLKSDGVLVVSGPTENFLYKIGRSIAGFKGDYHETNIFAIEEYLNSKLVLRSKSFAPFKLPLFSISIWMKD